MPDSKKIQESKNNYLKEKVDIIRIYVPKGNREEIKAFAKSQGKSLNAFVVELIYEAMGIDDWLFKK